MTTKKIAIIAHDAKKDDMVMLVRSHQKCLGYFALIATKGTGQLIMARTGLPVTLLEDGPRGGDQQVGALVAGGEVAVVIFLRDPLSAQPHEPDICALLRICEVHDIPLATNLSTAEAVLTTLTLTLSHRGNTFPWWEGTKGRGKSNANNIALSVMSYIWRQPEFARHILKMQSFVVL